MFLANLLKRTAPLTLFNGTAPTNSSNAPLTCAQPSSQAKAEPPRLASRAKSSAQQCGASFLIGGQQKCAAWHHFLSVSFARATLPGYARLTARCTDEGVEV